MRVGVSDKTEPRIYSAFCWEILISIATTASSGKIAHSWMLGFPFTTTAPAKSDLKISSPADESYSVRQAAFPVRSLAYALLLTNE